MRQTYIALLKGINVGGHKKVPMAELRKLLAKHDFLDVETYIQSGNVIFKSSDNSENLQEVLRKLILAHFGFEVAVIVKTHSELKVIFGACPFENETKENSYFIMLNKIPNANAVKEVSKISYEHEEIVIKNDCIYLFASKGYGQSKFNMKSFEKKLNVVGTARNYNTMVKLLAMSSTGEKDD